MRRVAFLRTTSRHSAAAGSSDRSSSSSICLRSATSRSSSLGRLRRPPPGRRPTRPSSGSSPRAPRCCGSPGRSRRAPAGRARAVRWLRLRSVLPLVAAGGVRRRLRHREAGRPRLRVHVALRDGRAARKLAAELSVPWVADLRDPWALDEWLVYPTRVSIAPWSSGGCEDARRRRRGRHEHARGDGRGRPPVPGARGKPVVTITNGFDPDDFAGLPPERGDDTFRPRRQRLPRARPGRQARTEDPRRRCSGPERRHALPRPPPRGRRGRTLRSARPRESGSRFPGRVDRQPRARHPPCVGGHAWIPGPPRDDRAPALGRPRLPPDARSPARRASADRPREDLRVPRRRTADPGGGPDGDARDLLAEAGNAFLCRPADVEEMARVAERVEPADRLEVQALGPRCSRATSGRGWPASSPGLRRRSRLHARFDGQPRADRGQLAGWPALAAGGTSATVRLRRRRPDDPPTVARHAPGSARRRHQELTADGSAHHTSGSAVACASARRRRAAHPRGGSPGACRGAPCRPGAG